MACKRIPTRATKICTGELKHAVDILERNIQTPIQQSFSEAFTIISSARARIDTPVGVEVFDGANNQVSNVTHQFYIRYNSAITLHNWVRWDGDLYQTLRVVALGGEKTFMRIDTLFRGDENISANRV